MPPPVRGPGPELQGTVSARPHPAASLLATNTFYKAPPDASGPL